MMHQSLLVEHGQGRTESICYLIANVINIFIVLYLERFYCAPQRFHSIASEQSVVLPSFSSLLKAWNLCFFCEPVTWCNHNAASKVNRGHETWVFVMGSKATSAGILPNVEKRMVVVAWKVAPLKDIISSTNSRLAVPPLGAPEKSAEPHAGP